MAPLVLVGWVLVVLLASALRPAEPLAAPPTTLTPTATQPFGTNGGALFVRQTGIFEGETSLGAYRVPYELVAPADPSPANGTVLFEPPHFLFGPAGRDFVLTRGLVFGRGFSYAAVGFGTNGLNILDPAVPGLVVAGAPVASPGVPNLFGVVDEEILVQFVQALSSDPFAVTMLGEVERRYAYGVSQTAEVLLETLHSSGARELFDLTLLHNALWKPPFSPPGVFDGLPDEFQPLPDVGRVLFVEAEGDLLLSGAEQFRRAAGDPSYRVYEVAGAAHVPLPIAPLNPLDHWAVARALLVAGDEWARGFALPPPSALLEVGTRGAIERDADGNALGGVRLPDLAVGRAQYIASAPIEWPPGSGLFGLVGLRIDLACQPASGSTTGEPRFGNHGDYVNDFSQATSELRRAGFLLEADAEALKEQASQSDVGKPASCDP
jgi:Alpha/beta hydrolase domain